MPPDPPTLFWQESDLKSTPSHQQLTDLAGRLGLRFLGVVSLGPEEAYPGFVTWLQEGRHAEMHFLENHGHLRQNPAGLLEGGRTALILAMPYNQGDRMPLKKPLQGAGRFRIAQYARMRDYHKSLRKKIEEFAVELQTLAASRFEYRVTVDSAPLLEKALAAKTQRGFIGKNTLYIHPEHGSLLLLGELLVSFDFEVDRKALVNLKARSPEGGCGSCRRCQVWCPTGALDRDYSIDAGRCLSYLTIEHRGLIPVRYWKWLEYYIFGCDICQLVCPWNRGDSFRVPPEDRRFQSPPSLSFMVRMTQAEYEDCFGAPRLRGLKNPV